MIEAFIFLLTLDDQQIFLYFFLEIVGHIGFISSVVIRLRLDIIQDDVIFLLIDGLQLFLQALLVRIDLFEDIYDTILLNLLSIRGRDLRQASVIGHLSWSESVWLEVFDERQDEMLSLVIWLF